MRALTIGLSILVCFSACMPQSLAMEPIANAPFVNSAFSSHGHKISIELLPASNERSVSGKVLIILPGSGGIEPTGGFYRDLAKSIAAAGTSCVIVHYMDRNNIEAADGPQMSAHLSEWLSTINDAVVYVSKLPHTDSKHVSILGHSLGAQLALHVAATQPAVYSVVGLAGCFILPTKTITHMPPVLILHGGADHTVPIRRERDMLAVLKRVGCRYSEHIFPRGDHVFNNVSYPEMVKLIVDWLK